ncbi:MAG: FAD-binding protein [Actinobacteria bacterium]|nr:FAD-binding protein [Actinomycetota bacterium]MBV8598934.1 FAD-binding protein [Actinomycetota bacterium]
MIVAGAGMAGLVAAVRARELGVDAVVYEKGARAGGSMLLSSGVVWRHREWDDFRRECPGGDERLQRLVWERFDDALAWLVALGAPVVWEDTPNPVTTGKRFDTCGLTETLCARAGEIEWSPAPLERDEPTILATGGFAASPELVAEHIRPAAPLRLRANPWSTGDGLRAGLARGGSLSAGMDEFYGRNMPDRPWAEDEYVSASQLYARRAHIVDEDGVEFFRAADVTWSETNVVQATARRPGARAYYVLDESALADPDVVRQVEAAGEARVARDRVRVVASITHTIGGVVVDEGARVVGVPALYAAGVDAGGVATGGYASGLAQALVLGLAAAESVLAD